MPENFKVNQKFGKKPPLLMQNARNGAGKLKAEKGVAYAFTTCRQVSSGSALKPGGKTPQH